MPTFQEHLRCYRFKKPRSAENPFPPPRRGRPTAGGLARGEAREGVNAKHVRSSDFISRARALRKNMTDAERKLWAVLRRKNLEHKFRRQAPLGPYIVDFVCFEKRLVIEVDGGQHLDNPKDQVRDSWLREQGFSVLRFWNTDVLKNLQGVVDAVKRALDARDSPHPSPLPQRGEGE